MAVYDLEEQDKLEDLKAWWKQWGNAIAGVVVAICIGVIGVQGYRWWSQRQAAQASVLYAAVSTAVRANDPAKAKDAMAQLTDKYGGTGYAPRAALLVAAMLFESGDKAGAKTLLTSIIDRDAEDELKQVARLRLAAIYLDEKQYDDALRVLDAKHDDVFTGVYADARGDVLAATGRTEEARLAYQTAIARLDPKSTYRNFVQVKLDTLGGPIATPASTTTPAGGSTPTASTSPAANPPTAGTPPPAQAAGGVAPSPAAAPASGAAPQPAPAAPIAGATTPAAPAPAGGTPK